MNLRPAFAASLILLALTLGLALLNYERRMPEAPPTTAPNEGVVDCDHSPTSNFSPLDCKGT